MAKVFFVGNMEHIVAASFGSDPRMVAELQQRGRDLIAAARSRVAVKRGVLVNSFQPPEIFFRGSFPGVRCINSAPHALVNHNGAEPRTIYPKSTPNPAYSRPHFAFYWERAGRMWWPFFPPPNGPKNWINWPGHGASFFWTNAAIDLGYEPAFPNFEIQPPRQRPF